MKRYASEQGIFFLVVAFGLVLLADPAAHADKLSFTGSTSEPASSTFVLGQTISLNFKATGLGEEATAPRVNVAVDDEFNNVVWKGQVTMQKGWDGAWTVTLSPPAAKAGFYRVYANLIAQGKQIPVAAEGSRPAGFITYCVVLDPANRPEVPMQSAFFGMQGAFTKEISSVIPMLGIRWVLGDLDWHRFAPDDPSQFKIPEVVRKSDIRDGNPIVPFTPVYNGKPWHVYPIPTLYQNPPKWIAQQGWGQRTHEWRAYCQKAVKFYMEQYPDLPQRIYQVTWEPNNKQQFDGTQDQLVTWHQIAYETVHQLDPRAIVIGPAAATVAPYFQKWHAAVINAGIWKFIDGYSVHAYTTGIFKDLTQQDLAYDQQKLIDGLRLLRSSLSAASGRNIPIYSTEAGHATSPNPRSELVNARELIETNIIMYGEGVRTSLAFFLNDYPKPAGFGLYYNLKMDTQPVATTAVAPKPSVPAYSAMTYFLENASSLGPGNFGAGTRSYRFRRGSEKVDVVWTLVDSSAEVSAQGARFYDWMGNPVAPDRPGKVLVGPQPVYIVSDQ